MSENGFAESSRSGPLRAGERIQLTDAKGKLHTITLTAGATWQGHKGHISHDEIIGSSEGSILLSTLGAPYFYQRPLLEDFVLSMPRGATIVYPKDAAEIIAFGDIHSGDHVLEAGVGSGALTISLLRAVGSSGRVLSIERREDFGTIAAKNISLFFGSAHPAWELQINSFQDAVLDEKFDRVVLDMLAPWDCIEVTAQILRPGGVFIGYVTTTTQLSRLVEALRAHTLFTEPESWESLHRPWHVESLSVRPEHRMISHTGFLVRSRRVADGVSAMRKRRRPSKPDEDDLLDQE